MSLILEALRKSEAERRRGQAPDLLTGPAPVKRQSHAALPGWWPWAAAVAALLLVAWLARDVVTSMPEENEADSPTTLGAANPPVRDDGAPPPQATPAPVNAPPTNPASAGSAPAPAPASSPLPTPPPAPAAMDQPAAEVPAPVIAAKPDITPPAPATASSPIIEAPPPLPAPAQPTTPPTFTSPDSPLRLSDLSTEERQQLPPLKISMHMWAPEPAQRFVIIDGNRVTEGDRVGSAVVEAITSDGVTLAWQGRRIQLPIR